MRQARSLKPRSTSEPVPAAIYQEPTHQIDLGATIEHPADQPTHLEPSIDQCLAALETRLRLLEEEIERPLIVEQTRIQMLGVQGNIAADLRRDEQREIQRPMFCKLLGEIQ